MKASQGGREHDSDILMKSSSELQSNLVTTSLLIHYIRICDLVLKNNFVWTLIRYCFNFRCLIYINTSLYASPSFLRGRCHLARRFCTFSFTVFARFVARALIFFNQTHYRALIQTGPYSSTGACYFQSKIMHKNYR